MEVDQEILLEVEDQEMILLQILHKDLMVEMETHLTLGVQVVVAEQQQLVLVPVQHLVLEEQEQQVQLMAHQLQDQVVVAVADQIMVIQVVDQEDLVDRVVLEELVDLVVLVYQELQVQLGECKEEGEEEVEVMVLL